MTRVLVVAEAAACHDGDLDKALRLVDLAAEIGADVCKFQYASSAEALCTRRRAPQYLSSYRLLELPDAWLARLSAQCEARKIDFLATCYLPDDIAIIAPLVRMMKVASFEASDAAFVRAHFPFCRNGQRRLLISLGFGQTMADIADIPPDVDVVYLHCVSAYPAPLQEMNLRRINATWPPFGLSDHSAHEVTGAVAVALGARVIEFHLRLYDIALTNADYHVALAPDRAARYVRNIRDAEALLGDNEPAQTPSEAPMAKYRRVSR